MSEETQSVVLINENALDRECIKLPSDYLRFAHLAADKKRDVDELKTRMDLAEAELAAEIRTKPEEFGLEKVTESAIREKILTLPRYQKALARVQAAKHETDLATAVVNALEHKKRTLTLLVDLHGMGYFSDVKISQNGKEAVQKMSKDRVGKALRSRED